MGFKAIKQHYDIGYIVAIYNEEKYGGDCICIGSGFVHGLIAINIETGKVFYSSLVTPGENSEIGQLAARIKADEKNGVLRALIDEPDTFARNLPVFTTENWAVKAEQCEEYGLLGRCKKEFPPAAGRRRRGLSVLLQSRRIDNRSRFAG